MSARISSISSWFPSPVLYETEGFSQPSQFVPGGRWAAAIVYLLNTIRETTAIKGQFLKQDTVAAGLDKQGVNSTADFCQLRRFLHPTSGKVRRTSVKSMDVQAVFRTAALVSCRHNQGCVPAIFVSFPFS